MRVFGGAAYDHRAAEDHSGVAGPTHPRGGDVGEGVVGAADHRQPGRETQPLGRAALKLTRHRQRVDRDGKRESRVDAGQLVVPRGHGVHHRDTGE